MAQAEKSIPCCLGYDDCAYSVGQRFGSLCFDFGLQERKLKAEGITSWAGEENQAGGKCRICTCPGKTCVIVDLKKEP